MPPRLIKAHPQLLQHQKNESQRIKELEAAISQLETHQSLADPTKEIPNPFNAETLELELKIQERETQRVSIHRALPLLAMVPKSQLPTTPAAKAGS